MKKILSLLLMLALLLSTTCAFAETSEEPYTITYLASRGETSDKISVLMDILALYQEEHPNFNIEVESVADRTAYLQKVKILASSNELPDWFDADPESFFASLVDAGYIADMEAVYDEIGVADKFFNISKEYARLPDGRLNLFTWECNAEYFFYNKEIFKAAGIEQLPATMDELIEDCEKIVAIGKSPFAMGDSWPKYRYFAMVPFRMAGNDYIEQASRGEISWGNEVGIEGAKWMQKLASYFQEGWTTADYDTMVNLFLSGECAMLYNGTWMVSDVVDENMNLLDQYGVFGIPSFREDDKTNAADYFANSGIGTAVLASSMDDQMKDFLKFFFEHYPDLLISKYNSLPSIMPSNMEALPDIYQKIMNDAAAVNTYAKCWDVVIDQASLQTLNSATVDLCLGAITPEEWGAEMDQAVADNLQ